MASNIQIQKTILLGPNKTLNEFLESIGKNFRDDFVANTAERDRPEVNNFIRGSPFRNQNNVGFLPRSRKRSIMEELIYSSKQMLTHNMQ